VALLASRAQTAKSQKLAWLLVLIGTACVGGGSRMPAVSPSRTLGVTEADPRGAADGPFRVVFSGPTGETSQGSEISIVFSWPIRALDLAGSEAPPPVTITPPAEGRWQWVGTQALLFVPASGRLPSATRFSVEIPAGTRALDGATLGGPHRFEFSTPRPKLVRSEPWSGARGLEPRTKLELRFNQPIDPDVLERSAKLSARTGQSARTIAFSVERPDPKQPKRLRVVPERPLPVHSSFRFEIAAALVGAEGPLPAGEAARIEFETYGPLSVESVDCLRDTPKKRCASSGSLELVLSNPVRFKDLKRAIAFAPPLPIRWESWRGDDDMTGNIAIVAPFKPGASYGLRVDPLLRDRHGQNLRKPYTQRIEFDDLWPDVEIGVRGDFFEPKSARAIPVGSVNVNEYELSAKALSPDQVMELLRFDSDEARMKALVTLSPARTVRPKAGLNVLAKQSVDPLALLGGAGRGPIALATAWENGREGAAGKRLRSRSVKIAQVTDLAISAKLSRHGSLVWVTRLSSAEPVAGAKVLLRKPGGKITPEHQTDARGLVRIPASDFAPNFYDHKGDSRAVLFARAGDDWSFRPVSDYLSPWRLDVSTDLSGRLDTYGMLFTERGIYRPGDRVHVKGIVRSELASGNAVPSGKQVVLSLGAPTGEVVSSQRATLSSFGTFAADVRVPAAGSLGNWSLSAKIGSAEIHNYFDVAEYRPAEFEVKVESDRPAYVRGDRASWTIRGAYLFGAAMAKSPVRYSITRSRSSFVPPGSEQYVSSSAAYFDDLPERSMGAAELASDRAELDAQGKTHRSMKLELQGQRGPELLVLSAEVTDVSRQAIAGSSSAIVHPAAHYVGIRPPSDYFVDAPGEVRPKLVALSPNGQLLGGKQVQVELVRRRWTVARQETGESDLHAESKPVDTLVGKCQIVTAAQPVACTLKVAEGGYHLIRASSRDERGNEAQASTGFFALGPGAAWWRDGDTNTLELATNKTSYSVGDTARVLVKSPFPEAEALVTVERAGVYRTERRKLVGSTPTIEIPITEELRPNAYVAVHLVRPRTKPAPAGKNRTDVGAPQYRVGYAALSIDAEARRLKVELSPSKPELRPGETIRVDLLVKDAAGKPKPAEVTLYAVDEGVLSLIGYKTPDPLPVFTAARDLQVATLEARDSLARVTLAQLTGALGLDKGQEGGGGGEGGPRSARRDFRQSAYFNPAVMAGADGKASVSFKLPESLTTFRVMAVAVSSDDRYGYGDARVVTSRRLMARPALPRFARSGDSLDAGVVVTGKGFGPADVSVRAAVSGLELIGSPLRNLKLDKDGSVEVRFPMRAKSSGTARLRFDVEAEGERDAVELTRQIMVPTAFESVALYGETKAAAGEKLGNLSAIRRDVGELSLSVASTALVGLDAGVEQLVDYPYGCTEQLSSRLLPLLPLRDLARDFKFELPKNSEQIVSRTLADLIGRQRGDGGFGNWPDSPESSPWVSAYTLWTLHHAERRGAKLPAKTIERAKAYVRRYLGRSRADPMFRATAAFMLDVLAEIGAPDVGYMSQLYEQRKELPLFGQAFLLHAMAVSQQKPELIDRMVAELEGRLRIDANAAYVSENLGDEYAVLMDSPGRSSALALRALIAARPNHALASKLARGLLQSRRGGSWRSTQETAYSLLALDDYRKAQERVVPDFVAKIWLGGSELLSEQMRGKNLNPERATIPASRLGRSAGGLLVFEKQGAGSLFYEARLRYARKSLPSAPLERGFFVQKTLRAVTPESLPEALRAVPERGATRFQAGELVLADLVIVTPSPREFVVIEDPLPAGLEAVDARLTTTAGWLAVAHSGGEIGSIDGADSIQDWEDELAHGRAFLESWYRREIRDDRVLFFVDRMPAGMYHYRYLARATTLGKFIVPPTKAEEMYSPEVFGRTGAMLAEVR
jgi:alpha-2-macroglobulin